MPFKFEYFKPKSKARLFAEQVLPKVKEQAMEDIMSNPELLKLMLDDEKVLARYKEIKIVKKLPAKGAKDTSSFSRHDIETDQITIKKKTYYKKMKGEYKFNALPNKNRDRWGEVKNKFFNALGQLLPKELRPDFLVLENISETSIIPGWLIERYIKEKKITFDGDALTRPYNINHGRVTKENKFFYRLFKRYKV
tara:strand:- start:107 stop:691 length:585 start_codon:yes stop_codon:yes gene_type:complete